ncbi:hypothetical protein BDL97_06G081700 [Sphagnum fallax]|nr:hypothetical protein BDL97_06G081700 [Sphagnum fallax]
MTMAAMKKSMEEEESSMNFVMLADGRRIAYEEKGVEKRMAKQSFSSVTWCPLLSHRRHACLSDFNQKQTYKSAAGDIAQIADALELGEKFWLLGYSGGGPYCWAAARFIPERLAGIAMWAPVGNYGWKDISKTERKDVMRRIKPVLSPPDVSNLNLQVSRDLIERDSIELAKQKGKGVAQDWLLLTHDWGFELSEMLQVYQGPLHIFHGDLDWVVPLFFQQCINKLLPDLMHLHILNG